MFPDLVNAGDEAEAGLSFYGSVVFELGSKLFAD